LERKFQTPVADDGVNIPESSLRRVFHPFFALMFPCMTPASAAGKDSENELLV
jgi:hypothetical protein